MEELKLNELVKVESGNIEIATDKVDQFIDYFDKIKDFENEFRTRLLELMIERDIQTLKTKNHTCSQVKPKDTIVFNTEQFIQENPSEILCDYVSIEQVETGFDKEALKTKYPEIYNEFVKTEDKVEVDLKKLKKNLPTTYYKYASEVKSDRAITLKVK